MIHNKIFFEKLLGPDMVVDEIFQSGKHFYVFYYSRKYYESGFDDRYKFVGVGPLLYNTEDETYRKLGIVEFFETHYDPNIFPEKKEFITLEEVKNKIRNRGSINFSELEEFMNQVGIDSSEVLFLSNDNEYFKVVLEREKYFPLFTDFFDSVKINYKNIDSKTLIFHNPPAALDKEVNE